MQERKKEKINKDDINENIKEILDIVKGSYYQYYERTQSIDNKNGFFITFHGAVLLLAVDPVNINCLLKEQSSNIFEILKCSFIVVLEISILILAIISICLFIFSLKSRNIKYLPITICEEKYYKSKNQDFIIQLLNGYRNIAEYNEGIINRKHNLYNSASIITLIEIILIGINLIIKML